jgi:DNA-binding LacI/PurR family transcriptional regulator
MGERIAAEVLAGGSQAPTAVIAANDQMALGVIAALENAGLSVPDDVSVVGIDDALEGTIPHNRLTTLRFDLCGIGKLAFEAAIGDNPSIEAIRVPSTLVERSTVRDIRA